MDRAFMDKVTAAGQTFTFADQVSKDGQNDYAAFEKKSVTIAYSATTAGTTATFTTFLVDLDGNEYPIDGFRVTGSVDLVKSAKPGEVVEYEKPAGLIFRVKHTAPTGGGKISAKAAVI